MKKKSLFLSAVATDSSTESDPAATAEASAADYMVSYVNVDRIDSSASLKVYRWSGSRPDLLRRLDAAGVPVATITAVGVTQIDWPHPLGAAAKLTVEFVSTTTALQETIFEIDNVYRTEG